MKLLKGNWLLGIFIIPLSTDIIFTMIGQPKAYWHGYKAINEALPIHFLFQVSPLLVLAAGFLVWLPIAYILTKKLPKPLDLWAAMAIFAGHTYNSVSWLRHIQVEWNFLPGSLIPMTVYILTVSYFAMYSLRKYFGREA